MTVATELHITEHSAYVAGKDAECGPMRIDSYNNRMQVSLKYLTISIALLIEINQSNSDEQQDIHDAK